MLGRSFETALLQEDCPKNNSWHSCGHQSAGFWCFASNTLSHRGPDKQQMLPLKLWKHAESPWGVSTGSKRTWIDYEEDDTD